MTKYGARTMTSAGKKASSLVGHANKVGYCLQECVVTVYGIPGPYGWGGNGRAWAYNYWLNAVAKGKVVKTSDPAKIPYGAMAFMTPHPHATTTGQKAGHVFIGAGGGYCYTTDYPHSGRWGKVKIADLSRAWGKTLLGYILVSGDGYTLTDRSASVDPADPAAYYIGAHGDHITTLGKNLVRHGFGKHYKTGPGPTFSEADRLNVQDCQKAQGFTGGDADGFPGRTTLAYLAGPASDPAPTPQTPDPPAESDDAEGDLPVAEATVRVLTINVGAVYVPSYNSRLDELEDVRSVARASLVTTCESGTYADGERLDKWFGWGGKRNGTVATGESFVLHGDSVPITTAVHFDPKKYDVLDEGKWVTVPSTTHRWATWVLLRHTESRVVFIVAVTHCQYLPKGPNVVKKYDEERYSQIAATLKLTKGLQAKVLKSRPELDVVPALVAGDMNSQHSDRYDASAGVSKAAKDNGFVDAGSTIIDRIFHSPTGVTVNEHRTVSTLGGTDHKTAFAASFTLTNRKK